MSMLERQLKALLLVHGYDEMNAHEEALLMMSVTKDATQGKPFDELIKAAEMVVILSDETDLAVQDLARALRSYQSS
ncbi:MAG: hypothetical protein JKY52_08310 [Flavobacteriales bacterium]|nr:hypothetical protein [Flavobacteriales bacterium]